MRIAEEHMPALGVTPVLDALGLSVATHYRRQVRSRASQSEQPARISHRALSDEETQAVLNVLHEPRFVDMAPGEVYATLLDEGRYIAMLMLSQLWFSVRLLHRPAVSIARSEPR